MEIKNKEIIENIKLNLDKLDFTEKDFIKLIDKFTNIQVITFLILIFLIILNLVFTYMCLYWIKIIGMS